MKNAKEAGLDQLRVGDWGGHAKQRLARKENCPFGQGPNVASELEFREIVKEIDVDLAETRQGTKIRNVFLRKAHVFQEVERLFQPRGDQVIAAPRQGPHKKFKRSARAETVLDVARRHRQLVQVRKQARV